jgi:hypothetical protein
LQGKVEESRRSEEEGGGEKWFEQRTTCGAYALSAINLLDGCTSTAA